MEIGRPRCAGHEQVLGFGRSASGKAVWANKGFTNGAGRGIMNSGGDKMFDKTNIHSPIERGNTGKGNPNAILHFDRPLNNRQQSLLNALPAYDSQVSIRKKDVSMVDLSALTAHTGDEYAMFTKGSKRLVIRGNAEQVNIDVARARRLNTEGYKWSGHTHPGIDVNVLNPSDGGLRNFESLSSNPERNL
jgi:hypothetical protein